MSAYRNRTYSTSTVYIPGPDHSAGISNDEQYCDKDIKEKITDQKADSSTNENKENKLLGLIKKFTGNDLAIDDIIIIVILIMLITDKDKKNSDDHIMLILVLVYLFLDFSALF